MVLSWNPPSEGTRFGRPVALAGQLVVVLAADRFLANGYEQDSDPESRYLVCPPTGRVER